MEVPEQRDFDASSLVGEEVEKRVKSLKPKRVSKKPNRYGDFVSY